VVNFTTVACRISSRSILYKNYKDRLGLAKVIVKNNMSRFYGSLCTSLQPLKQFYQAPMLVDYKVSDIAS